MRDYLITSLVAAFVSADSKDFPRDDLFHADCHLKGQIQFIYCADVYPMVLEEIQSWNDSTVAPAGGKYDIVEQYRNEYDDMDYIWTTRLDKD